MCPLQQQPTGFTASVVSGLPEPPSREIKVPVNLKGRHMHDREACLPRISGLCDRRTFKSESELGKTFRIW